MILVSLLCVSGSISESHFGDLEYGAFSLPLALLRDLISTAVLHFSNTDVLKISFSGEIDSSLSNLENVNRSNEVLKSPHP